MASAGPPYALSRTISSRFTSTYFAQFDHYITQIVDIGGKLIYWMKTARQMIACHLVRKGRSDANSVRIYQLTRNELWCVLDPQNFGGSYFSGETFRVLKVVANGCLLQAAGQC